MDDRLCWSCQHDYNYVVNWRGCELCAVGECRCCVKESGNKCKSYEQGEVPEEVVRGKIICIAR
jgi:hypothetical protein